MADDSKMPPANAEQGPEPRAVTVDAPVETTDGAQKTTAATVPASRNVLKSVLDQVGQHMTDLPTEMGLRDGADDIPTPAHRTASVRAGDAVYDHPSEGSETEPRQKKPPGWFQKLGLNPGLLVIMFKGSIGPLIAVAFYQATDVAETYGSLGYLVPIITVLSLPILPRARFIQTLLLNLTGICIGASIGLLGLWSSLQARKHTTPPGPLRERYNSSQATVCAIWLFVSIWFVNMLRAKHPAFQFPVIMYSIFTNVAFTYGPLLTDIDQGKALVKHLLQAFLTAFAIAFGVNMIVIPVSSRKVVFIGHAAYIGAIRKALKAQTAYFGSLEHSDMFKSEGVTPTETNTKEKELIIVAPARTPQAKALKRTIAEMTKLHGKLHGDMAFAKREFAHGKLNAADLAEIMRLFQAILIPIIGVSTATDIFERIAERRGWIAPVDLLPDDVEASRLTDPEELAEEKRTWMEVMKVLHESFAILSIAMDLALQHAGLLLEMIPQPKKKAGEDLEAAPNAIPKPGDKDFSKHLIEKMKEVSNQKGNSLRAWARLKGISEDRFNPGAVPTPPNEEAFEHLKHQRDQQQLYIILYMEHLLYSTGMAIAAFVQFAEKKVEDGTMAKNRFLWPGQRRLRKWLLNVFSEDTTVDHAVPDSIESGSHTIYMGAGFNSMKRDLEHLPPSTLWQHFGNHLRAFPRFMGSTESSFGFRAACATLTIGIAAYLKSTQQFFVEQRLVWAMFMIAIGMTVTAGQSIFGLLARIAGTILAMLCSFVIWYIVDQKTPGILVMLWLFIFIEMYFFMRFPRFVPAWMVCIITEVMIVGYELQVRKIGIAKASATGQPYYPVYELAPYRLLCVAGGSFVAFIWTIFPYPLSDRSWLRRDLGKTLYLLANYYSVVHSSVGARLHDTEGDMESPESPGRQLAKIRHRIFGKLVLILPSLEQHSEWQKWEVNIGGKFPKQTYEAIIMRSTKIMHYLALISYANKFWDQNKAIMTKPGQETNEHAWLHDLSILIDSINPTSNYITSTLSLLSASVTSGTALPPFMEAPRPYDLTRRLEALDRGILDARHIEEPGYSAYAIIEVASSLLSDDLARLMDSVKELVGETDFSFSVPALQELTQTKSRKSSKSRKSGKSRKSFAKKPSKAE